MITVKSRLHPINALLLPSFLLILTGGLGLMLLVVSINLVNSGTADSILRTPIYGSVMFLALLIWLLYSYQNLCKSIQITDQGILFKSLLKTERIDWSEIANIELTGKQIVIMSPMEATKLTLKNGESRNIIAFYYENMASLRRALEQVKGCISGGLKVEIRGRDRALTSLNPIGDINTFTMNRYRGNHLLSFNGILIYGSVLFILYLTMFTESPNSVQTNITMFVLFFAFFYGFFGFQLHHFFLSDEFIVVKNHVWWWRIHKYRISDIKEVVFETPHRMSTSLRITTKDFKSSLYPAGSLNDSTWHSLMDEFLRLNIKVRNEAIF